MQHRGWSFAATVETFNRKLCEIATPRQVQRYGKLSYFWPRKKVEVSRMITKRLAGAWAVTGNS